MSEILIIVLNRSLAAGIVATAVMLARLALRKAPKVFSYALWAVVLLRLLCPIVLESRMSLMPAGTDFVPANIGTMDVPRINSPVPAVDRSINRLLENSVPDDGLANSVNPAQVALAAAAVVWLVGMAAWILYAVLNNVRLKRRIYDATRVRENLFVSDKIPTAFVMGLTRPRIYLPAAAGEETMDYMTAHEQVHIRRRDYLIKPFAFLILTVNWFNPVLWLSYYLMSKDMEMSCDEAVLRNADRDIREAYSLSLVSLYAEKPGLLSPLAFGEGSFRNMKARIKNVLNYKKSSRWIVMMCALLLALFTVGFTTNSPKSLSETTDSPDLSRPEQDYEAALATYYSGQSARPYRMLQKKIFRGWLTDWGDLENPVWNFDSFTRYRIAGASLPPADGGRDLYCCTFSADKGRQGYMVFDYDGSGLSRIRTEETPYLYDLRANLEEIAAMLEEAGLDSSTAVAERVSLNDTESGQSDEAIVFTDANGTEYIYYFDAAPASDKESAKAASAETGRTEAPGYAGDGMDYIVMDGTQLLRDYGITAQDFTIEQAEETMGDWIAECDGETGAYLRRWETPDGYAACLYYNGGGRYPWNMRVKDGGINVSLYSEKSGRATTGEGYFLLYFTSPSLYTDVRVYLDGEEIEVSRQSQTD